MRNRPARTLMSALLLFAIAGSPVRALVEEEAMVPMRDGTLLATTIFRPDSIGSWPLILLRTPYDKSTYTSGSSFVLETMSRGYALAVQDTRGRYASGGVDSTFWTDGWGANRDGYDTIEWLAAQIWCDGNVGMFGGSALGITQLLAAGAVPPSLKACFVMVACEDFYQQGIFQSGALREELIEWIEYQGAGYMIPFYTAHPLRDSFWDLLDLSGRAPSVTVPILHMGGHYDCFGEGAVDGFLSLQHGGGAGALGNQRLVLGPWAHTGLGPDGLEQGELVYPENSLYPYRQMRWRWWDRWLKGEPNGVDEEPPVEYYLMGDVDDPSSAGNAWLQADDWPPAGVDLEAMYLHPSGALLFSPPVGPGGTSGYVFDPSDPVPTLGGRNLNIPAGPYDQRPLDGRPDQLVFTSPVLTHAVIVVGKVVGRIFASSTAPDTDFTVKLVDVYPDGREMLVTDGVLRGRFRDGFESENFLAPDSVYAFDVDLWSTALAFDIGHRIQVIVSSSNSPRFGVNPNDGRPFNGPHLPVVCTNTVHMTPEHPSHVLLPVARPAVTTPALAARDPLFRLSGGGSVGSRFHFRLEMSRGGAVDVGVYGATGRLVRWIRRGFLPEGVHDLEWDGRSSRSGRAGPGVYFLRLRSAAGRAVDRKLVLCR